MRVYELIHRTKGTFEEPQSGKFGDKGVLGKLGSKSESWSHQIMLQTESQHFFKSFVCTFNILLAKFES